MQQAKTNHLLIVGSGPGISYHTALLFGKAGFAVSLLGRNRQSLTELVDKLKEDGIEASSHLADAADFPGLRKAISFAITNYGVPAVLLYNAAALHGGTPLEQSPDEFVSDFRVNVAGAIASIQTIVPLMRHEKKGTILLTGGGLSKNPAAGYSSLSIGKSGIRSLANSLSQLLSTENIQVTTVTVNTFVNEEHAMKIADLYWEIYYTKWNAVEIEYP